MNMPNRKQTISLAILLIIALLVAIPGYFFNQRRHIYPYDVTKNYEYDFSKSNAIITKLNINNGIITLPKLDNIKQSSFIKINTNATFLGKWLEPSITFTSKKLNLVGKLCIFVLSINKMS